VLEFELDTADYYVASDVQVAGGRSAAAAVATKLALYMHSGTGLSTAEKAGKSLLGLLFMAFCQIYLQIQGWKQKVGMEIQRRPHTLHNKQEILKICVPTAQEDIFT